MIDFAKTIPSAGVADVPYKLKNKLHVSARTFRLTRKNSRTSRSDSSLDYTNVIGRPAVTAAVLPKKKEKRSKYFYIYIRTVSEIINKLYDVNPVGEFRFHVLPSMQLDKFTTGSKLNRSLIKYGIHRQSVVSNRDFTLNSRNLASCYCIIRVGVSYTHRFPSLYLLGFHVDLY